MTADSATLPLPQSRNAFGVDIAATRVIFGHGLRYAVPLPPTSEPLSS